MELADERLEEIQLLEKKVGYLEAQLGKCAEFERELIRTQDDMKEKIDADFNVILVLKTRLDRVKEYINTENFHSDDSDNLKNLLDLIK